MLPSDSCPPFERQRAFFNTFVLSAKSLRVLTPQDVWPRDTPPVPRQQTLSSVATARWRFLSGYVYCSVVGAAEILGRNQSHLEVDPNALGSATIGTLQSRTDLADLVASLSLTHLDTGVLGDSAVATAYVDFHGAWVDESDLTAKAVGLIAALLAQASDAYLRADSGGGHAIAATSAPLSTQPGRSDASTLPAHVVAPSDSSLHPSID